MRATLQLATFVGVVGLATWALPVIEEITQPLDYESEVAGGWSWRMEQDPAEVILLGDSILSWGVDLEQFESLTGRNTGILWAGASASAWWYLVLKNFVAEAEPPPGLVALLFRDNFLTLGSVLVGPQAVRQLEAVLDEGDEQVTGRVLKSSRSPVFVFLGRHWSLVDRRSELRDLFERSLKKTAALVSGHPPESADEAVARTFDGDEKDLAVLDRAAGLVMDDRLFDFDRMLHLTFLPDIIRVARSSEIPMVFVRMKRAPRSEPSRRAQVAELDVYMRALRNYLEDQGFPLLDLSVEDRLQQSHYSHGDHMNAEGRAVFTPLLAAALEEYMPQLGAPGAAPSP